MRAANIVCRLKLSLHFAFFVSCVVWALVVTFLMVRQEQQAGLGRHRAHAFSDDGSLRGHFQKKDVDVLSKGIERERVAEEGKSKSDWKVDPVQKARAKRKAAIELGYVESAETVQVNTKAAGPKVAQQPAQSTGLMTPAEAQQLANKARITAFRAAAVKDFATLVAKDQRFNESQLGPHKYRQAQLLALRRRLPCSYVNFTTEDAQELSKVVLDRFAGETVITIRGYYSSGTNWLRALIKRNCAKEVLHDANLQPPFMPGTEMDSDGLYGWKHGYFRDLDRQRFLSEPHHYMFWIVREAPTWLVSAWRMDANNADTRARYTSQVIRKVYMPRLQRFRDIREYLNMTWGNNSGTANSAFQDMLLQLDGTRRQYQVEAENVVIARNKLQKHWAEVVTDLGPSRAYFMRYEDLLADPREVFNNALNAINVTCVNASEAFDAVQFRVKYGSLDKRAKPQNRHVRGEFCSMVEDEGFYQQILSMLDLEFEAKVLGYEYPPTRADYCRDVPQIDIKYYQERAFNESKTPPPSPKPPKLPLQKPKTPVLAQPPKRKTSVK